MFYVRFCRSKRTASEPPSVPVIHGKGGQKRGYADEPYGPAVGRKPRRQQHHAQPKQTEHDEVVATLSMRGSTEPFCQEGIILLERPLESGNLAPDVSGLKTPVSLCRSPGGFGGTYAPCDQVVCAVIIHRYFSNPSMMPTLMS